MSSFIRVKHVLVENRKFAKIESRRSLRKFKILNLYIL